MKKPNGFLRVRMPRKDKQKYLRKAKLRGFDTLSAYVRYLLRGASG